MNIAYFPTLFPYYFKQFKVAVFLFFQKLSDIFIIQSVWIFLDPDNIIIYFLNIRYTRIAHEKAVKILFKQIQNFHFWMILISLTEQMKNLSSYFIWKIVIVLHKRFHNVDSKVAADNEVKIPCQILFDIRIFCNQN